MTQDDGATSSRPGLPAALADLGVRAAREALGALRPGATSLPHDGEGSGSAGEALMLTAIVAVAVPLGVARYAASAAADRLVPVVAAALLSRLDVPALAGEYAQVNRLAALIDLDAVARRLDLDELASHVDVDALVDRVDIDRVLARTDVAGLARYIADEIDLPELLRATTGSVGSEMVHGVRDQGAQADLAVARAIDRFLRRKARGAQPAPLPGDPRPAPEAESGRLLSDTDHGAAA